MIAIFLAAGLRVGYVINQVKPTAEDTPFAHMRFRGSQTCYRKLEPLSLFSVFVRSLEFLRDPLVARNGYTEQ